MTDKIIAWVLGGIFVFAWFYVGYSDYYSMGDTISPGYLISAVFTVGLLRA
ncbi:MAG: hypothetical protein IID51_05435 [Proteobacteria bacterium]|nr:hypothetical protein [Pseudomonadota bacterium]